MIDKTLINRISEMAEKEKKINAFKKRLRIKGKLISKSETKKGNIKLVLKKDEHEYSFLIVKTHKKNFALAQKLQPNTSIWIEGIIKFRNTICTRLKVLDKGLDNSKQTTLTTFEKSQSNAP